MKALPTGIHLIYSAQYRRCGHARCKCSQGHKHGPYWYVYYREPETQKLKSMYVGKQKPDQMEVQACH